MSIFITYLSFIMKSPIETTNSHFGEKTLSNILLELNILPEENETKIASDIIDYIETHPNSPYITKLTSVIRNVEMAKLYIAHGAIFVFVPGF